MKGAAELVLVSKSHPAVLKDSVCSPFGTTIAGIAEMERLGVRYGLILAIEQATERGVSLGELSEKKKTN
jgi:pyrroline-5-carboxylate reductase